MSELQHNSSDSARDPPIDRRDVGFLFVLPRRELRRSNYANHQFLKLRTAQRRQVDGDQEVGVWPPMPQTPAAVVDGGGTPRRLYAALVNTWRYVKFNAMVIYHRYMSSMADHSWHFHNCKRCGRRYTHSHKGGIRPHGQFDFQCPYAECAMFIDKGQGKRVPTAAYVA